MGIWGLIGGLLDGAGKILGGPIGGLVALGASKLAKYAWNKLSKSNEDIGNAEKLDDNSNITTIEKLNEILYSYEDNYKKLAQTIENETIDIVNKYFLELVNKLKVNKEIENNIGLSNIIQKQQSVTCMIENAITNVIAKKISLDSNECREILELPPGDSKKYKMNNYCDKVLREAHENLVDNITQALNEQNALINSFLEGFINEKERSLNNMHQFLINLEKEQEQHDFNAERIQMLPKLKIELIEQAYYKLGA